MNKESFIKTLEAICPTELAESWDNCGFQIDGGGEEIATVLVALEVTGAVIDEAEKLGADLILTHHPLIFGGISAVDNNSVTGKYIYRLICSGIDVYSCHTNFDKVEGGNNDYFGKLLGMKDIRHFDRDNEFCRKGTLAGEVTLAELASKTAATLGIDEKYIRFVGNPQQKVKTCGWCTGAGTEFIKDSAAEGCQVFITGDLKYHDAQTAAEQGMAVIDAGHYGSEKIFAENMTKLLRKRVSEDIKIISSEMNINPFV